MASMRKSTSKGPGKGPGKGSPKSAGKQPEPINKGGSYMAFNSGKLLRTYGKYSPMESIDTTGFGKGKKEFPFTKSYAGAKPIVSKVKRQDVPGVISKLKSGATRFVDYRTPSQKKK